MHPECFTELENQLIKRVKAMGFSNSAKSEKFKSKLNFDRDHVKDFLWKDNQKGGFYGMIYKEMTCNCGKGLLTKDMSWPPPNYRRSKKKIVNNSGDSGPKLPTLQGKPGAGDSGGHRHRVRGGVRVGEEGAQHHGYQREA